jgi:beta-glucanase (GH16 family)
MKRKGKLILVLILMVFTMNVILSCSKDTESVDSPPLVVDPDPDPDPSDPNFPLSDQENAGNWVLNQDVSDEFNGTSLDEAKWQIQGKDGIYKSNFVGRHPSQFSPNNAVVNDGKLQIWTKWEPDFPFSDATREQCGETYIYENITTAAVISREQFQYGYMEVRIKSANARITSSFWTTGNQSELDMFEMFGGPQAETSPAWAKRLKFNMISWNPNNPYYALGGNSPAHTRNIQIENNTADDFNVYGFEWTADYMKVYVNGELHPNGTITKAAITNNGNDPDRWVTDVPYWIWFDSETFCWLGLLEEQDLPVAYEIDYVRIWQN